MAFYRCGGGGITRAKLYEALQYSGLVTPDMTAEEMLEALREVYPELYYLYNQGDLCESRSGGYEALAVRDVGMPNNYHGYATLLSFEESRMRMEPALVADSGVPSVGSVFTKKKIDFTGRNTLFIEGTFVITASYNYKGIIIGLSETKTEDYVITTLQQWKQQQTNVGSVELDVSAINGEYYIVFELYGNDTSDSQNQCYVYIDKMWLD